VLINHDGFFEHNIARQERNSIDNVVIPSVDIGELLLEAILQEYALFALSDNRRRLHSMAHLPGVLRTAVSFLLRPQCDCATAKQLARRVGKSPSTLRSHWHHAAPGSVVGLGEFIGLSLLVRFRARKSARLSYWNVAAEMGVRIRRLRDVAHRSCGTWPAAQDGEAWLQIIRTLDDAATPLYEIA
jgi:hypothetical protein